MASSSLSGYFDALGSSPENFGAGRNGSSSSDPDTSEFPGAASSSAGRSFTSAANVSVTRSDAADYDGDFLLGRIATKSTAVIVILSGLVLAGLAFMVCRLLVKTQALYKSSSSSGRRGSYAVASEGFENGNTFE